MSDVLFGGRWIDHDTIDMPQTAVGPGEVTGIGSFPIGPDDPRFKVWADWLESTGHPRPERNAS